MALRHGKRHDGKSLFTIDPHGAPGVYPEEISLETYNGAPLNFIQEDKTEDPQFWVVLDKPLSQTERSVITVKYGGKDAVPRRRRKILSHRAFGLVSELHLGRLRRIRHLRHDISHPKGNDDLIE